jgi:hypothetical protein
LSEFTFQTVVKGSLAAADAKQVTSGIPLPAFTTE